MDYIWLDEEAPILKQIPAKFRSAAFILHPFVRMPLTWEKEKENYNGHIYPTDKEILELSQAVSWKEIQKMTGLCSYKEVALSLITSIGAFTPKYERQDLAQLLNEKLGSGYYFPSEDTTPVTMYKSILEILSLNDATTFYHTEPIFGREGKLPIKHTNPLDIPNLAEKELLLLHENEEFAFINIYDSFVTLFMSTNDSVEIIVKQQNWEAIICDERTTPSWYFDEN